MKKLTVCLAFLLLLTTLSAAFDAERSDYLFYRENDYEKDYEYLLLSLENAQSTSEKAEILWRLGRTRLTLTDEEKEKGTLSKEELLSLYGDYSASDTPSSRDTSSAFYYAYESLQYKESAPAYHWLSSAVGRCGQVHGALNSLSKAKGMKNLEVKALENFTSFTLETDSWYVLSILYNSLPGGPISFGNNNYAISYMRKCLDTQDMVNRTNGTNYLELAEQLYERNWSKAKRSKEFSSMLKSYEKEVKKNSGVCEINKYYEGYLSSLSSPFYVTVKLEAMSDRDEALTLLQYAKNLISAHIPYAKSILNREKMEKELEKVEEKIKLWS